MVCAYDPLQPSVFLKMGLLKGKTVGLIGAKQNDVQEVAVVQSTLRTLHVKVAQTSITTAQPLTMPRWIGKSMRSSRNSNRLA